VIQATGHPVGVTTDEIAKNFGQNIVAAVNEA